MSESHIPKFEIQSLGRVFHQGFQVGGARTWHFLVKGKEQAIQQLCLDQFAIPTQGRLSYRGGADLVHIRYTEAKQVFVLNQEGEKIGKFQYRELSLTVFLQTEQGTWLKYTPFRFTDNGTVMNQHRELIGLPTSFVSFSRKPHSCEKPLKSVIDPAAGDSFFVQCCGDIHYRYIADKGILEEEKLAGALNPPKHKFIKIKQDGSGAPNIWEGAVAAEAGIAQYWNEYGTLTTSAELPDMENCLGLSGEWVNLKQYRSVRDDVVFRGKASYQAVVQYGYRNPRVLRGGRINGPMEIRFPDLDHQYIDHVRLRESLGLEERYRLESAFWTEDDFQLQYRRKLWEAELG